MTGPSSACRHILGVDIGGTTITLSVCREQPGDLPLLLESVAIKTRDAPDADSIQRVLTEGSRALLARHDVRADACGISCGGPLDPARGLILSPPNLPPWGTLEVVRIIEESLEVPAQLLNDADAGALVEWRFGAGVGVRHVLFITHGSGFGAGIIANGALYQGSGQAGEIGHVRLERSGPVGYGKSGSIEGFCSGGGIAQLAQVAAVEQYQQGREVAYCDGAHRVHLIRAEDAARAAVDGDPVARDVFDRAGDYLGRALALLVDLFAPQRIVLGAVYQRAQALIEPSMRRALAREALASSLDACEIVPARFTGELRHLAAYAAATYRDPFADLQGH
ncbi:MAG: ROK family protein [Spirochaetaceae bacterium]|nr:MAG: ROK family protein [Spirochaetaceae bacterium]